MDGLGPPYLSKLFIKRNEVRYEAPKRTKLLYAQISMLILNKHTNACFVGIQAFKISKIHPEM